MTEESFLQKCWYWLLLQEKKEQISKRPCWKDNVRQGAARVSASLWDGEPQGLAARPYPRVS